VPEGVWDGAGVGGGGGVGGLGPEVSFLGRGGGGGVLFLIPEERGEVFMGMVGRNGLMDLHGG
jgi:hypothetical protein